MQPRRKPFLHQQLHSNLFWPSCTQSICHLAQVAPATEHRTSGCCRRASSSPDPAKRPPTSTHLRLQRKHELREWVRRRAVHLYCSPTTAAASRSVPPSGRQRASPDQAAATEFPRSWERPFPEQQRRSAGRRPGRARAMPPQTHGTGKYGRRRQSGPCSITTTRSNAPRLVHTSSRSALRGAPKGAEPGLPRSHGWAGTRRSLIPAAPPGPALPSGPPHPAQGPRCPLRAVPSGLPHCAVRAQHLPGSGAFAISGLPARSPQPCQVLASWALRHPALRRPIGFQQRPRAAPLPAALRDAAGKRRRPVPPARR